MPVKHNINFIKRAISILIIIVMALSMIPIENLSDISANAASGHTHNGLTFSTAISDLTGLTNLFNNGGSGYLTADIKTSNGTLTVKSGVTVNLCLDGHMIQGNGSNRVISNNGTLNIYDCGTSTTRNFKVDSNGLWSYTTDAATVSFESLKANSTLESGTVISLKGGCLTGGAGESGAGIYSDGNLNLYGGNIVGNSAGDYFGGGIVIASTLTINEGVTICGNYAKRNSGGVFDMGTLVMNGGNVSFNTTELENNSSSKTGGGGIRVNYGATIKISGNSKVYGNLSNEENSNVYMYDSNSIIDFSGHLSSGALIYVSKDPVATSSADVKFGVNAIQSDIRYIYSDLWSSQGPVYCNGTKDYDMNKIEKTCHHSSHTEGTLWMSTAAFQSRLHTHTWTYSLKTSANNIIQADYACENNVWLIDECEYHVYGNGTKYLTLNVNSATYSGNPITATVTADEDFPVEVSSSDIVYYTNAALTTKTTSSNSGASASGTAPVKAGTYYAAISAGGVTAYKSFTINKIALTNSSVTLSKTSFNADGNTKSPTVTVKASVNGSTQTLTKDTDYTISGDTSKTEVNSYTLKVTGTGNFSGTVSKTWKIVKSNSSISSAPTMVSPQTITYDGNAHNTITFTGTVTGGTIKYQSVKSGSKTSSGNWITSTPTVIAAGTYDIYYMVVGNTYYSDISATKIGTFTIVGADQTAIDINTLSSTAETIYGKADGKISGVTTNYEYSVDGIEYNACTGTEVTGLAAGKVYIRKAASGSYNASPSIEITVQAGEKIKLSVPENANYTVTAVPAEVAYNGSTTLTLIPDEGWSIIDPLLVTIGGIQRQFTKDENGNYVYTLSNIVDKNGLKITGINGIEDITPPTASVTFGTNFWDKLLNTITFGLFFKETQTINADVSDEGSGIASTRYYVTDDDLTIDEVSTLEENDWTDYSGDGVDLIPSDKFIVYFKVKDNSNNVTYISTNGLEVDAQAPIAIGIQDGGIYYDQVVFSVIDTSANVKVLDDGLEIASDNETYRLIADDKDHIITIKDGVGNKTVYRITLIKIETLFNKYKASQKLVAKGLERSNDSYYCKKLISDAIKEIDGTAYDPSKTLLENEKVIDEIIAKLKRDLAARRALEKKGGGDNKSVKNKANNKKSDNSVTEANKSTKLNKSNTGTKANKNSQNSYKQTDKQSNWIWFHIIIGFLLVIDFIFFINSKRSKNKEV